MIYRAELGAVRETLLYLARDCCNGRPEVCTGLVDALVEIWERTELELELRKAA